MHANTFPQKRSTAVPNLCIYFPLKKVKPADKKRFCVNFSLLTRMEADGPISIPNKIRLENIEIRCFHWEKCRRLLAYAYVWPVDKKIPSLLGEKKRMTKILSFFLPKIL